MSEVIEILKRIESKLEEIDERLKRIEEELFDELSEEELRELEMDLKAYKEGKLEMIDLEEVEKRYLQSQTEQKG
jgi:predicted  nucleic acid-binding Zn-ribbon protein